MDGSRLNGSNQKAWYDRPHKLIVPNKLGNQESSIHFEIKPVQALNSFIREGSGKPCHNHDKVGRTILRKLHRRCGVLLYWRKGELQFTTDVEDWMASHDFTEVFSYSGHPSNDEMAITTELDGILHSVRYGDRGIEEVLNEMAKNKSQIVIRKQARHGQQSLGSAEGTAVDEVFKNRLLYALNGHLKKWKSILTVTPRGSRGADVISPTLHAAWDVTTVEQVWEHVERDVFGKRGAGKPRIGDVWDRYYILVWDEPRTNKTRKVAEIQAGRLGA